MKKIVAFLLVCGVFFSLQINLANAATPSLSLSNTGEGDNVQLTVSGDANSSVILSFQKTDGTSRLQYLSNTNASGYYSGTISTSEYGITPGSSVLVKVNNIQSSTVAWPYTVTSGSGAITLSNTGLIMTVGSSNTITVNNTGSNKLYLLNNSNPQVANVNLSNSQATIYANTFGQTVATICVLGTTSNCASAYITVQNSGAKALTLSQSNLTIAYNQSSQITILNSTGLYSVLNNSNPNVITASIKDQTITLVASSNGGSASITVCSTDMSTCGIINASVGSVSSTAITFNQTAPTLGVGQTLNIAIAGGSNYNISSNSNSNIVNAYIANNALTLVGSSVGSSVVTVCASNGNCNSLTAVVSYTSTGGPITLSQSNLWLQVGQAVSVVISGGSAPYSFINDANSASYFSTSLNTNILTLTGAKAGSASLSVCSAGGACTQLSVLVNGVSANTQLTFGSNNLSLKIGATSDVSLYGTGSYYISSTNNQNVATFAVNGSKVTVNAISAGNANVSICQSGGQCGIIYVAVTSSDVNNPIFFSSTNPSILVGQTLSIAINGGTGSAYYISSNSNPSIAQVNLSDRNLVLLGKVSGSSVVTVCSATNSCSSLAVTVNAPVVSTPATGLTVTPTTPVVITPTTNIITPTTAKPKYKFTKYLSMGALGAEVSALQTRLLYEKVYTGPVTGKFGAQTYAAVKAYQKKNKITQLGVVGPATRALLNK